MSDFERTKRGVVAPLVLLLLLFVLLPVPEAVFVLSLVVALERRCITGVVALDADESTFARRARCGVVGVGVLLGGALRTGPGDLGGTGALETLLLVVVDLLLLLSSGVAGRLRRTGPGECDVSVERRLLCSGAADVLLRLSRIEPVRTKFLRSGAGALILSALAVSVSERRVALARLSGTVTAARVVLVVALSLL